METETLIAILSILAPTLSSIVYLGYWLGRKFGKIDERFRQIDERLEQLDRRFDELREYVDGRVDRLGRAFSSYQEFFVEYLSVKGVVSASEATMLKNEAARLSLLAAMNPFTKEEWEKLKRFLEKDPGDFTLREAEEFRELGRKAIAEYWERPEAYKLHLYTCVVYGLALRKLGEEKGRKEAQEAHP
jgi:hypothetical protein